MRSATICLLACLSCGGHESTETPSGSPAGAQPANTTPSPSPACDVAETFALASPASAPRLLALTLSDEGGLLLAVDSSNQTSALSLDARGHEDGSFQIVEFPRARGLLALSRLGTGFVAISEGACEAASHCLHAIRIDTHGARVGDVVTTALPSAPLTLRRRRLGGRLLLALSTQHAAPRLFTYAASRAGLEVNERTLADGDWPDEANATILTLTTDASRWAVLYRVGATEAPTSHVVMALEDGEHEVPTLDHALAVDASAFDRDGLTALVSYEFFRPKIHRLHFDGAAHVEARELVPGASLPHVFLGNRRGNLEHGERLEFVLRTAAGDRLGAPLTLADHGRIPADVARIGMDFFVITANGGRISMQRLRCDPEPSP